MGTQFRDTTKVTTMKLRVIVVILFFMPIKTIFGNVSNDMGENLEGIIEHIKDETSKTHVEIGKLQEKMKMRNQDVAERIRRVKESQEELKEQVILKKDPPYLNACAALPALLVVTEHIITYRTFLMFSTNVVESNLDLASGMFTCGWPGFYSVSWSLYASNNAGDHGIEILLRKNMEIIEETKHWSFYNGPSGEVIDQGSRTIILRLERGETLDLYCKDCSAAVDDVVFCVSLSTPDMT